MDLGVREPAVPDFSASPSMESFSTQLLELGHDDRLHWWISHPVQGSTSFDHVELEIARCPPIAVHPVLNHGPSWLLNTSTLKLEYFDGVSAPNYGVLSHTWTQDETSFKSWRSLPLDGKDKLTEGTSKIVNLCNLALRDGLDWVWADTCCINRESIAELSEAINLMYRWYKGASRCYVYLADTAVKPDDAEGTVENLSKSRWFKRGWTLQEMLAPLDVQFFGSNWSYIGSLARLTEVVSEITNIDRTVLRHEIPPSTFSIAQRMSWASDRTTTRVEDTAYCLMGLLNVHMPLIYGEGSWAFLRLQEELIRDSSDDSIFAWETDDPLRITSLFASSPSDFKNASNIISVLKSSKICSYQLTNRGLRTDMECVSHLSRTNRSSPSVKPKNLLWVLHCQRSNEIDQRLALRIVVSPGNQATYRVRPPDDSSGAEATSIGPRLISISKTEVEKGGSIVSGTIYGRDEVGDMLSSYGPSSRAATTASSTSAPIKWREIALKDHIVKKKLVRLLLSKAKARNVEVKEMDFKIRVCIAESFLVVHVDGANGTTIVY